MIQGGSHFRKVITILSVTYLLHVNAATNNENVINEINRLESAMKTIKTPPELIDAVLKQVDVHCRTNKTIDQSYLNETSKCIEKYLNVSKVADDMRDAVPEGKMDTVFQDLCIKWPNVKGCVKDFFDVVDECWQKGDKVSKFIDEAVKFYCGDDNGGERIAIFFAEGGLDCVQERGEEVKRCVEEKNGIDEETVHEQLSGNPEDLTDAINKLKVPQSDEICKKITELHECASIGLKKCKDPTPENLMTSMLRQVGKALECKVAELQRSDSQTSSGAEQLIAIPLLALGGIAALFAF